MSLVGFLSEREELRAIALVRRQPDSASALQEFVERVKARGIPRALQHPRLAKRLEGVRYRVLGADVNELKPAGRRAGARLGELGIYDYDRDVLVVAVFNLRTGQLVRIDERKGVQPPLSAEEAEDAKAIVLADERFRNLRRRAGLDIVSFASHAGMNPSHPGYGHRCFTVYLWTAGRQPKRIATAVVDLTARTVLAPDPDDPAFLPEDAQGY